MARKSEMQTAVDKFKREMMEAELAKCTEDQKAFFHRIYKGGVPDDKVEIAYDLCRRTTKKNDEGRP